MGNSITPQQQAEHAELEIFQFGIDWWTSVRQIQPFHNLPKLEAKGSLNITMEVADTPCESANTETGDDTTTATMHSVKFSTPSPDPRATPLIVFPGYGSGTGIFYSVLPGLTEQHSGPVYVLDFLGCGLSTRRPWTLGYGREANLNDTEAYFCDAIEQWRVNMNITKMVLSGHSMGGYLTAAYCERYPESVERLVLISPVGVPDADPTITERLQNAPYVFLFSYLELPWYCTHDSGYSSLSLSLSLLLFRWYFKMSFSMWESGYSPMAVPGTWHLLGFHGKAR